MKKQLIGVLFTVLSVCIVIGCSQSPNEQQPEQKTPVQVEKQQIDEVPAIKIVDDKLFVDDKEIPAKDFVEKYCYSNGVPKVAGNPTCMAAYTLQEKLERHAGGAKPKNW